MDIAPNTFKHALQGGQTQIGLWCSLCSNIAAEIVADSGFDWLLLDTEHSPNEVPDILAALQAVQGRWEPLSSLSSPQAIIEYLRAHDLDAVAGAIQQSLEANKDQEPARDSAHLFLQTRAIKQGLIDAYRKSNHHRS